MKLAFNDRIDRKARNDDKAAERASGFKAILPSVALAGALLAGGSCGRTGLGVHAPDGAAQNNDALVCAFKQGPKLTCASAPQEGLINQGETSFFESNGIKLDGVEKQGDVDYAVISVVGSKCETIDRVKVAEGTSQTLTFQGKSYEVEVGQVSGATGAAWAKVKVNAAGCAVDSGSKTDADVVDAGTKADIGAVDSGVVQDTGSDLGADTITACALPVGPIAKCGDTMGGIVNQGESLLFDGIAIQLDDLEAHSDKNAAILSVLDANCNILKKMVISQGATETIVINGRSIDITVNTAAVGYTFGAKWADISLNVGDCGPDGGIDAKNDSGVAVDTIGIDSGVCNVPPGTSLSRCGDVSAGILNPGETLLFNTYGLRFEGPETSGEVNAAIVSVLDKDCNVLKKDKIREGVTKEFTINGKSFDVTVKKVAPGYIAGAVWTEIAITAGGCEIDCMPFASCGSSNSTTETTLGEGESRTVNGFTVKVNSILMSVGLQNGSTCPISDEQVSLQMTSVSGDVIAVVDPVSSCERTTDGCYTVKVVGVSEDVGSPINGACPVMNKKTTLEIKTPK